MRVLPHLSTASALALVLTAPPATPQTPAVADDRVAVVVPDGVPLMVTASDFSASEFEPRGGALVIELAGWVRFRHEGEDAVRAVTLAIRAHEQGLGGRAAVSIPSLHAPSGHEFDVHLNLRMLRPLPLPPGPVVRVAADAVLFDTLAAAGPDRLDSVRKLKVLEMEARRDREYFLTRWRAGGRQQLAAAMQVSLRRQATRPRLDIRLAANGPTTAVSAGAPREIQFAFAQDADAPLLLERGSALVTGTVMDTPRIILRNRATVDVRRFELGWLVTDATGRVYSLGAAPVGTVRSLGPGTQMETGGSGRFEIHADPDSGPIEIRSMSAYVRSVSLADGSMWVPSRLALQESRLLDTIPVSAEEQRLSRIYRDRGPDAVIAELRKLHAPARDDTVP